MNTNISWCIPVLNRCKPTWHHPGSNRTIQLSLLDNCVNSLIKHQLPQESWEFCITDFGSKDVECVETHMRGLIKDSPGTCELQFKQLGETRFNRGLGLNTCYSMATHDNIVFFDADMLVTSRKFIDDAINFMHAGFAWFPICRSYRDAKHTEYWKRERGKGNVCMSRELYETRPGGWLEKDTWGHEDYDFYEFFKLQARRTYPDYFYHQWHPVNTAVRCHLFDATGWRLQS